MTGLKIAVTGASGNLGTALLQALNDRGHETIGICRRPPQGPPYERTRWVALDLASPDVDPALLDAFQGVDAVVHLAWIIQPARDVGYMRRVNLGGTRSVLDAITAAGVRRLVHMSSSAVYAPERGPAEEAWTTTGIPTSEYSRQKVAAEGLLDDWMRYNSAVAVARMRPTIVTQQAAAAEIAAYFLGHLAPSVAVRAARRWLPILPVPRGLELQFVHAADVAQAVCTALERRALGAFNLAADTLDAQGLADAVRAKAVEVPAAPLRTLVGLAGRARLIPIDQGWFDLAMHLPVLDTSRARRVLDWRPMHSSGQAADELTAAMAAGADGPSPALTS
jgi:UDP-glucose 4-epimerase